MTMKGAPTLATRVLVPLVLMFQMPLQEFVVFGFGSRVPGVGATELLPIPAEGFVGVIVGALSGELIGHEKTELTEAPKETCPAAFTAGIPKVV